MTDPKGHREGWVGRNEEHSCNGLFPYRQDLKFPVQHFTRCLLSGRAGEGLLLNIRD